MSEAELQANVALYLKMQYPEVLFHSDFGSGVKLQPWQARAQKLQNGGRRAWPDMFIAEPKKGRNGMFIEFKKEGVRLRKLNGDWASSHIKEQADLLEDLRDKNYEAEFAVGYEEALTKIDNYLGE